MKLFVKKPTVDEAKAKLTRVEEELARLAAEQESRGQRVALLMQERGELLALQAIGERIDAGRLETLSTELSRLEREQRDAEAVMAGLRKAREAAAAASRQAEAEDLHRRLHEAVLHHLEVYREFLETKARLESLGREADMAKAGWKTIYDRLRSIDATAPVALPSGPFNVPETMEALEDDVQRVRETLKAGYRPE